MNYLNTVEMNTNGKIIPVIMLIAIMSLTQVWPYTIMAGQWVIIFTWVLSILVEIELMTLKTLVNLS